MDPAAKILSEQAAQRHAELVAAVDSLVTSYRDDLLIHDRNFIRKNPGVPFLHHARTCGTWLTPLRPADDAAWPAAGVEVPYLFGHATREHIALQLDSAAVVSQRSGTCLAVHHFDGKKLRRITVEQSVEIAHTHTRSLLATWKRDGRHSYGKNETVSHSYGKNEGARTEDFISQT
jgi:hypothetical protein